MAETKKIRHELYAYLESQFGKLTPEQRATISSSVQEHSDNRAENLKAVAKKAAFANDKISQYLVKGRTNPKLYAKEIQVLEMVKNWLNKGDN